MKRRMCGFGYAVLFFIWTCCIGIPALPFALISREWGIKIGPSWAGGGLWMLRVFCGVRSEIRGLQYRLDQPAIYAVKHQSAWDTLIFWRMFARPVYVYKKELLWVPFLGLYLWLMGNIGIDRSSGSEALKKMIAQARRAIAAGRPIIIFPEGTRTSPGEPAVYQPGIAALYKQLGVPVVPVALNSGLYWGKNAMSKRPGKILMEFLPAIPPGLKSRDFLAQLEQAVETATARLVEEGKRDL